jgi:PAS domain-containing protein
MNLALLRALPDPSFLITTAGTIVGANAAAGDLLGVRVRTLAGNSILEYVSSAKSAAMDFLAISGRTFQAIPGSICWKHRDGAIIETRCDGSLMQPTQNGEPAIVYIRCRPKQESIARFTALNEKIAALSHEIQQRRKIQEALRNSEERYRTLVAATTSAVWSADASAHSSNRSHHGKRLRAKVRQNMADGDT